MGTVTLVINNTAGLSEEDWDSLCDDMLAFLEDITPVDTGFCQDSWEMTVDTDSAIFHNSAEYSSYLDEGWSDQAPAGMTGPALDELPSLVEQYT